MRADILLGLFLEAPRAIPVLPKQVMNQVHLKCLDHRNVIS